AVGFPGKAYRAISVDGLSWGRRRACGCAPQDAASVDCARKDARHAKGCGANSELDPKTAAGAPVSARDRATEEGRKRVAQSSAGLHRDSGGRLVSAGCVAGGCGFCCRRQFTPGWLGAKASAATATCWIPKERGSTVITSIKARTILLLVVS